MVDKYFYKKILKTEFLARCDRNPSYSLSAYSKSLNLSQSYLSKLLLGNSKLSVKKAKLIAKRLKLSQSDQNNFIVSVSFDNDPSKMVLTSNLKQIIEDPIYHSILNVMKLDEFESSSSWISKKIQYDREVVELAIEKLEQAGLIKKINDKWERSFPKTESHDQTSPEAQKKFHKAVLKKAIASLDEYSSEERNITGVTMSIDPSQLNEAAKEISRFRERISKILENGNGKKTNIYHLEVGLFPL